MLEDGQATLYGTLAELEAVFHFSHFFEGMALASNDGGLCFFFWWRSRWLATCCWYVLLLIQIEEIGFSKDSIGFALKRTHEVHFDGLDLLTFHFLRIVPWDSSPTIWENMFYFSRHRRSKSKMATRYSSHAPPWSLFRLVSNGFTWLKFSTLPRAPIPGLSFYSYIGTAPPASNSHHRDYSIFSRESLYTFICGWHPGWGGRPNLYNWSSVLTR